MENSKTKFRIVDRFFRFRFRSDCKNYHYYQIRIFFFLTIEKATINRITFHSSWKKREDPMEILEISSKLFARKNLMFSKKNQFNLDKHFSLKFFCSQRKRVQSLSDSIPDPKDFLFSF